MTGYSSNSVDGDVRGTLVILINGSNNISFEKYYPVSGANLNKILRMSIFFSKTKTPKFLAPSFPSRFPDQVDIVRDRI